MAWFTFGMLTALFFALLHAASKFAAAKEDPYYLSNAIWLTYSVIALPLVFLFPEKISLNREAFLGFILLGLLICSTNILYLKSLKEGALSRTAPLLSITPVFTLLIAMLWLQEFPGTNGIMGIALIMTGTYFLNFEHFRQGQVLAPILHVIKDRSSRLMLVVAAAYGLGSVTDKFIINHSGTFARVVLFGYFTLFFNSIYLLSRDKKLFFTNTKRTFGLWKEVLLITILYFLTLLFQMLGLSLTYTAYIIALKRTSAAFSVMLGYFIFNERRHFSAALAATLLMLAGVFLMAMS